MLSELVKYQIYIEALKFARTERQKKRDEKQVNRILEVADDNASVLDSVYSPTGAGPIQGPYGTGDADENGDAGEAGEADRASREEGAVPAHMAESDKLPRDARRSSGNTTYTATTAGEFYDTNEGRASTEAGSRG